MIQTILSRGKFLNSNKANKAKQIVIKFDLYDTSIIKILQ